MAPSASVYDGMKLRQTVFYIAPHITIPDERVRKLVANAFHFAPRCISIRYARGLVLLGDEHKKLWDLTLEVARSSVPHSRLGFIERQVELFRKGYGTVSLRCIVAIYPSSLDSSL